MDPAASRRGRTSKSMKKVCASPRPGSNSIRHSRACTGSPLS
ncbi:hypothetical protein WCD74_15820 [Actinomycetospora sp. OC33-EN08]|uniref:Uncharacterized protein n=1 Tax=Actinomycetospora aurantiaca TaxID=3129233 RepID=A0ABU8MS34_9PSEU